MSEAATALESLKNLLVKAVYLLLTSSFLLLFTLLFPFPSNKKKKILRKKYSKISTLTPSQILALL